MDDILPKTAKEPVWLFYHMITGKVEKQYERSAVNDFR